MDGTSATHASTATLSRKEAGLLPTSTYPRSPSCWHVCLHDGPSWPSSGSWQLGPFDLMMCVRDAHSGLWDALQWDIHNVMKQCGEPWTKMRGRRGVVGSKSGKQTLAPRTNTYASNMSHDLPTRLSGNIMRHLLCMFSQNFLISNMEMSAPQMGSSALHTR